MKDILKFAIVGLFVFALSCHAAEFQPIKKKVGTNWVINTDRGHWYDNIHAGPVGVVLSENITGPSQWGAGLDIGYEVNKYVSIDLLNLSFEGAGKTKTSVDDGDKHGSHFRSVGEDRWGGLLIDETDLDVRANLVTFATEKFKPYVIASGVRNWNRENWGIGVGAGATLSFNKYVALGGSYRIRSFFNEQKNGLGEIHFDLKLP